jgi:hypothetical protein
VLRMTKPVAMYLVRPSKGLRTNNMNNWWRSAALRPQPKVLWGVSLAPFGGWTATGVFSSRRGPGEAVVKKRGERTRNYEVAMQSLPFSETLPPRAVGRRKLMKMLL